MPNLKSSAKALRQSIKKRERNLKKKVAFRSVVKDIKKLVSEEKIKDAETLLPQAYKAIDKAAKAGVIKPNTASRKKSRLTLMIRRATA